MKKLENLLATSGIDDMEVFRKAGSGRRKQMTLTQ